MVGSGALGNMRDEGFSITKHRALANRLADAERAHAAERERLYAILETKEALLRSTESERVRFQQAVERLHGALREYGRHRSWCAGCNPEKQDDFCTCGLNDALSPPSLVSAGDKPTDAPT